MQQWARSNPSPKRLEETRMKRGKKDRGRKRETEEAEALGNGE